MRRLRSAVLVAVVLCGAAAAWGATDEEMFLALLKKFGVTDDGLTSKKPCLCVGGSVDGEVGRLTVFRLADRYHHECHIPFFSSEGLQVGGGNCRAILVLPKQ